MSRARPLTSPVHILFRIEQPEGPGADPLSRNCYCLLPDAIDRVGKSTTKRHKTVVKADLQALTTNLHKHLRKWHPKAHAELEAIGSNNVVEYCKGMLVGMSQHLRCRRHPCSCG